MKKTNKASAKNCSAKMTKNSSVKDTATKNCSAKASSSKACSAKASTKAIKDHCGSKPDYKKKSKHSK